MTRQQQITIARLHSWSDVHIDWLGMRADSMAWVRRNYATLPNAEITIYPDGRAVLVEGRHRLRAQMEAGQRWADATLQIMTSRGTLTVLCERRLSLSGLKT